MTTPPNVFPSALVTSRASVSSMARSRLAARRVGGQQAAPVIGVETPRAVVFPSSCRNASLTGNKTESS
jgi:hypothetical protein